jgi:hypothetical protein
MKQKQNLIILAAIGIVFLLFWLAVITLVLKLRGSSENATPPPIVDMTLCDENAKDLCIVNFGANSLNRMVINFQLPTRDYAQFYVKATNRGTVSVYMCKVDEVVAEPETKAATETTDETATATKVVTETATATTDKASPTSVHCTGIRTPLGETIDVEVYTTDGDQLIGRGTFLVSAIALPTPVNLPSETPVPTITATEAPVATNAPTDVPTP